MSTKPRTPTAKVYPASHHPAPRLTCPPPRVPGFAEGGVIPPDDIDTLRNKYPNRAAQQPAQDAQQPKAPPPQPQQQSGGLLGRLFGTVGKRNEELRKAAAYGEGGKIQGPGTPKSDSIPATVRETGEGIAVSTRERILSVEQDAFLDGVARAAGYKGLDAMLEDGTGKPVGPTIKAGKRAAADGMAPDQDPFAFRGGKEYGAAGPVNGPNSTGLDPNRVATSVAAPPTLGGGTIARTEPAGTLTNPARQGIDSSIAKPASAEPNMIDMATGNAALAKENAIRQQMIDRQPQGVSGIIKDQGLAESNALMDKWGRQDQVKAIAAMPPRTANAAAHVAAAGINAEGDSMRSMIAQRGLDLREQEDATTRRGQDMRQQFWSDRNDLTARGQDMRSGTAADRMASQERIAETRTGPTLAQQRGNAEVEAARQRIAGMSPEEIRQKTTPALASGRDNPAYDPSLARAARLASRRLVGDDPEFDARQQPAQPQARLTFTRDDVHAAIGAGADRAKVAERIKSMGGNPADYGL